MTKTVSFLSFDRSLTTVFKQSVSDGSTIFIVIIKTKMFSKSRHKWFIGFLLTKFRKLFVNSCFAATTISMIYIKVTKFKGSDWMIYQECSTQ